MSISIVNLRKSDISDKFQISDDMFNQFFFPGFSEEEQELAKQDNCKLSICAFDFDTNLRESYSFRFSKVTSRQSSKYFLCNGWGDYVGDKELEEGENIVMGWDKNGYGLKLRVIPNEWEDLVSILRFWDGFNQVPRRKRTRRFPRLNEGERRNVKAEKRPKKNLERTQVTDPTSKEKKDAPAASADFLDQFIETVWFKKYQCGVKGCAKYFHTPEFVKKHLLLMHPELMPIMVDDRKNENIAGEGTSVAAAGSVLESPDVATQMLREQGATSIEQSGRNGNVGCDGTKMAESP